MKNFGQLNPPELLSCKVLNKYNTRSLGMKEIKEFAQFKNYLI